MRRGSIPLLRHRAYRFDRNGGEAYERIPGCAALARVPCGGLRAVAAPIRDRAGRVIGSVNISTHASRTSLESMRRNLVPPLLAAAARISADIPADSRGGRP